MVQRIDLGVGLADIEVPGIVGAPIVRQLGVTAALSHWSVRNERFRRGRIHTEDIRAPAAARRP